MATKKTTTKETTTKKVATIKAAIAKEVEALTEPEPAVEKAEKKPKKPKLSLMVNPEQPQANFQFTVEVSGLDPVQSATLEMWTPGGATSTATVSASPEGVAQWLMLATQPGEHDLVVTAEGKGDAEETIDVLP